MQIRKKFLHEIAWIAWNILNVLLHWSCKVALSVLHNLSERDFHRSGPICASWILHKICLHAQPLPPPQTKRCDWCPKLFFADWWLLDLPWPFLWSYHINILNISLILVEYTTDVVQYAPAVHCTNFVLMRKTMESVWSTVGFGRDSMWKLRKMRFKEAAYLAYLGSAQQIYKKFTAFRVWNHENCVQWWSLKIQHTWSAEQYAL